MGAVPTAAGHRLQHDERRLEMAESNESITVIENADPRNADEILLESLGYKQVTPSPYFTQYVFFLFFQNTHSLIW